MLQHFIPLFTAGFLFGATGVQAQLNILTQFNPSATGGACGIAYNAPDGEVLVIGCSAATIDRYAEDGTFLSAADMIGEEANDVDIDMSPADLMMNGTFVAQGQLLLVNGETDAAEIYAIDEVTNQVIDTLATMFGVSHVVGGAYHPQRGTFFLVQDLQPSLAMHQNRVAEIDPGTGDTVQTFYTHTGFTVNYGDLDVSPISGNLFVVSSAETTIAEYTANGQFVIEHDLPAGVSSLSGIALDNDLDGAWVCNTSGTLFKLGNFPVGLHASVGNRSEISVIPNPAGDVATLSIHAVITAHHRTALFDAFGRHVRDLFSGTLPQGIRSITLDLDGIAPGTYRLMVFSPSRTMAQSLVIAR